MLLVSVRRCSVPLLHGVSACCRVHQRAMVEDGFVPPCRQHAALRLSAHAAEEKSDSTGVSTARCIRLNLIWVG